MDCNSEILFQASNNLVEIRTCADSATALAQLLKYYVSDGDLGVKVTNNENKDDDDSGTRKKDKSQSSTSPQTGCVDPAEGTLLSDSTTERLHDMMEDAMKEISSLAQQTAEGILLIGYWFIKFDVSLSGEVDSFFLVPSGGPYLNINST